MVKSLVRTRLAPQDEGFRAWKRRKDAEAANQRQARRRARAEALGIAAETNSVGTLDTAACVMVRYRRDLERRDRAHEAFMAWLAAKDAESRRQRRAAQAEEAREEARAQRMLHGAADQHVRLPGHARARPAAPLVEAGRIGPVLLSRGARPGTAAARVGGASGRPQSARRPSQPRGSRAREALSARPSSARGPSPGRRHGHRRSEAAGRRSRSPRRSSSRPLPRPNPLAQPVRVPRPTSRARSSALPDRVPGRRGAGARSRRGSRGPPPDRLAAEDGVAAPRAGPAAALGGRPGDRHAAPLSTADRARQLWEAEVAMLAREAAALRGGSGSGAEPAGGTGTGGAPDGAGGHEALPQGAAWAVELSPASSAEALSAAWPRSAASSSLSLSAPRRRARVPAARRPMQPGHPDDASSHEAAAVQSRLSRLGRIASGLERRNSLRSASTGEAVTAEELMAMVQRAVEAAGQRAD